MHKETNRLTDLKSGGCKIYVVGHNRVAEDALRTENNEFVDFHLLARKLAVFIGNQQAVINLIACVAPRGNTKDPTIDLEYSFAAKLHERLKWFAEKDIPVVARNQLVAVESAGGKSTADLELFLKVQAEGGDSENLPRNIKHPGSKIIFTTGEYGEQIKFDAYDTKDMARTRIKKNPEIYEVPQAAWNLLYDDSELTLAEVIGQLQCDSKQDKYEFRREILNDTKEAGALRRLIATQALNNNPATNNSCLYDLINANPSNIYEISVMADTPIKEAKPFRKAIAAMLCEAPVAKRTGLRILAEESPLGVIEILRLTVAQKDDALFQAISSELFTKTVAHESILHELVKKAPEIIPELVRYLIKYDENKNEIFFKLLKGFQVKDKENNITWDYIATKNLAKEVIAACLEQVEKLDESGMKKLQALLEEQPRNEHAGLKTFSGTTSQKERRTRELWQPLREKIEAIAIASAPVKGL